MSDLDTARGIVDRWLEMSFGGKWLTTQGYIQRQRVNLETLIMDVLQDARAAAPDTAGGGKDDGAVAAPCPTGNHFMVRGGICALCEQLKDLLRQAPEPPKLPLGHAYVPYEPCQHTTAHRTCGQPRSAHEPPAESRSLVHGVLCATSPCDRCRPESAR